MPFILSRRRKLFSGLLFQHIDGIDRGRLRLMCRRVVLSLRSEQKAPGPVISALSSIPRRLPVLIPPMLITWQSVSTDIVISRCSDCAGSPWYLYRAMLISRSRLLRDNVASLLFSFFPLYPFLFSSYCSFQPPQSSSPGLFHSGT